MAAPTNNRVMVDSLESFKLRRRSQRFRGDNYYEKTSGRHRRDAFGSAYAEKAGSSTIFLVDSFGAKMMASTGRVVDRAASA
jgi:hypothetical protein